MTEVLHEHIMTYSDLPPEQWAIRRGHCRCLDALTVDSMVAKEAKVRLCDLSVAWIDYQKAYNRVPHEWISWMLSFVKAPLSIQYILANLRRSGAPCSAWVPEEMMLGLNLSSDEGYSREILSHHSCFA